jgi:hypothetical protein
LGILTFNFKEEQVSKDLSEVIGRVVPAPENFLSAEQLEGARKARRKFMGTALAMGAGVAASAGAATKAIAAEGEDAILKCPWPWSPATVAPANGKPTCGVAKARA